MRRPCAFWARTTWRWMADEGLTRDAFLGGKVMVWQPAKGYRAGVDAVFLAAATPAKDGDSVLELGCGVGTASLCLAARVPGVNITGVEWQGEAAALARRNAEENGARLDVVNADLEQLPVAVRTQSFDHVMANPPYFDREASLPSPGAAREAAMGEDTPLDTWVEVAARRLKPRGRLTMIHRAERLPGLLTAVAARLGSLEVLPLAPRVGRAARLILLRARKDGRAPFKLHAPVTLHAGDRHTHDGDDYTAGITAVLRDGAALNFPA